MKRFLQEIVKKNTWNIRRLVDESFVPTNHIEDCQIFVCLDSSCLWNLVFRWLTVGHVDFTLFLSQHFFFLFSSSLTPALVVLFCLQLFYFTFVEWSFVIYLTFVFQFNNLDFPPFLTISWLLFWINRILLM